MSLSQPVRAVILALLLGLFVRTFLVETFVIESASMAPALVPGDHVLVNRLIYSDLGGSALLPQRTVRRGDVVVLRRPGGVLFKRVVAVAGDVLELRGGQVLVDGRPEAALPGRPGASGAAVRERVRPIRLRSKEIYVLGDARSRSRDSRHWGPAQTEWLRGRAILIYWSSPRPESSRAHDRDWDKMTGSVWLKIRSTRWDRCLLPVR